MSVRHHCVIVTGASSQVGRFLLPLLSAEGREILAISRDPEKGSTRDLPNVRWIKADITREFEIMPPTRPAALIHIAPVWDAPRFADGLRPDRIVAVSSTSAMTKAESASPKERDISKKLLDGEKGLAEACAKTGAPLTIFRPTMIYGAGLDKNVTSIARFIKKAKFFPIVGEGRGLRQPIHAEDLARAILSALDTPSTFGKTYNIGGGETLTYRAMVERIFTGLGLKPLIINVPPFVFETALRVVSLLPRFSHITPQMAGRMSADMVFDNAEAVKDFGYSPRSFDFRDDPGRV